MAEHSAVNRRVVSSSLTCGANFQVRAPQKGVLSYWIAESMYWVYVPGNPRPFSRFWGNELASKLSQQPGAGGFHHKRGFRHSNSPIAMMILFGAFSPAG